jgi:hypothetical protein
MFALVAIAATLMFGRVAFADAAPVQLILLYMPNVSNTGTQSASGVAELVPTEGEVRIKVADLPRLDDPKQYVAWVVNSKTNDFQRLGAFNTAASTGAVDFETVEQDAIPDKHWDLLLITVEDDKDAAQPSSKHSIAGTFPSPDNAPLPVMLPNTGGAPDELYVAPTLQLRSDWPLAAGLAALVFTLGGAAGYVLGHNRR